MFVEMWSRPSQPPEELSSVHLQSLTSVISPPKRGVYVNKTMIPELPCDVTLTWAALRAEPGNPCWPIQSSQHAEPVMMGTAVNGYESKAAWGDPGRSPRAFECQAPLPSDRWP